MTTIQASTSITQTNSGILLSVIPGHLKQNVVAMTLMALARLPNPEMKIPIVQ